MQGKTLSDVIQHYLRMVGYSQQNLAATLGLHPVVLSRKLHGKDKARLTQKDIKKIIVILVQWRAITSRAEVFSLLELAQLKQSSFSQEEWQSSPLNQIEEDVRLIQESLLHCPGISRFPGLHNLPTPVTRLIGRAAEVEQLLYLLDHTRLITLVGPGGCGKTRLALEVALKQVGLFTDGIWFISLAELNDPAEVPVKILQEMNIPLLPANSLQQSLIHFLQHKEALLLLDNFEHVQEMAPFVSELLRSVPALKILVTSRSPLQLYGEYAFRVPLLDVPRDSRMACDPSALASCASVQLFVERVQEVVPGFMLTRDNGSIVAQICACLDGLPLSIELAAARMTLLSPTQLLENLQQGRLSLLGGGARDLPLRQRTMRNVIEWSYRLLDPLEQSWFARLAVFCGGCFLDAVTMLIQSIKFYEQKMRYEVLVTPASFSLEILEALFNKSVLMRQQMADGQIRLVMLETLREYALERLEGLGERELLLDLHACYYLQVAEVTETHLRENGDQRRYIECVELEYHNMQAALTWVMQRARGGTILHALPPVANDVLTGDDLFPRLLATEVYQRLRNALRPYWEWRGDGVEVWQGLEIVVS